jgi:hypothetical protein
MSQSVALGEQGNRSVLGWLVDVDFALIKAFRFTIVGLNE